MRDLGEILCKPHSYVQKVETGERRLDVVELVWYCKALNKRPGDALKAVIAAGVRVEL